jgi:YfiR/HmsC-like
MAILKAAARANPGLVRWVWIVIVLFAGKWTLSAQTATSAEYQIKAVFLFNFARFVDWPAKAFPEVDALLVIGVLGDDPFGSYLDETVRGEKVNGHPLAVQRYRRVNEIKACHVLFVSRSEADRLDQIVGSLRGRSILTVGDTDDFTAHGGMIRLATEKNKVRMHINLDAVKAANLAVSSKLLRVAEIQH